MAKWNPSTKTFRLRLAYVVNEQIDKRGSRKEAFEVLSKRYNRSPQTIKRWLAGTQQPQARIKRNVSESGRRIGGKIEVVRNRRGKFEAAPFDKRAQGVINSVRAGRQSRFDNSLRVATNERQRTLAQMRFEAVNDEDELDLARRFEKLQLDKARGIDTRRQWRKWKRDYDSMMGSTLTEPEVEEEDDEELLR